MIGIKKLIKAAEELNWTVSKDGNDYGLQKFSDYGQDFNIYISWKTAKSLID